MSENIVSGLKQSLIQLIEHLCNENIIKNISVEDLNCQTFNSIVVLLRDTLREEYPNTKLKPIMKSVHYANNFSDMSLKESAFVLDEIEQYLCVNKYLDHDKSVKYFNKRITAKGFEINQENLFLVMIESLLYCKAI